MNSRTINDWIPEIYAINKANGFHDKPISNDVVLMLITSEIAEAVEADRKGKRAKDIQAISETKNDDLFFYLFQGYIKDTIEDEFADIVIRCCDYLGANNERFIVDASQSFLTPFYDLFAQKAWEWVKYLFDNRRTITGRIRHLLYEVICFCDESGIDIEQHVRLKLRYNRRRPFRHGKIY